MRCMNAVDNNTIIVTVVHDCQVIDIDADLMTPNDISVDFIVTPTRVIECTKQDKPMGIIWNMLSRDKFNRIPVLRKLRQREREAGIDVTLAKRVVSQNKEDDADDKAKKNKSRKKPYVRNNQRKKSENTSDYDHEGAEDIKEERRRQKPRRRQTSNRQKKDSNMRQSGGDDDGAKTNPPRRTYRSSDGNSLSENDGDQSYEKSPRRNKSRKMRAKTHSVFVGDLPRSLRVSEMKSQIRNQGVNPLRVVWHGGSGHAFLFFLKKREANFAIEKLTNVKISDQLIRVEMSRGNKDKQRTVSEQSETGAESNE